MACRVSCGVCTHQLDRKANYAAGMILGASSNMDVPTVDGDWSKSTS